MADRIAALIRAEFGKQRLVGVFCHRDRWLVAALLGVHAAECAYLPLDAAQPSARIASVVADAEPDLIVTTHELFGALPAPVPKLIVGDDCISFRSGARGSQASTTTDPLAYVTYTSGTTGSPKGVAVSVKAMNAYLRALREEVGGDREQIWMAVSSVTFDSSVAEIFWPVIAGHRLCLGDNSPLGLLESQLVVGTLDGRSVTHMQCAPSLVRMLMGDREALVALTRVRTLLLGGEKFPIDLVPALNQDGAGPRLLNVYGPTETTVWVARSTVTSLTKAPVTIGETAAGSRIYVLDDDMRPIDSGEVGRLFVAGAQVANGYWRCPELTAEKFHPDPFATDGSRMYDTGDVAQSGPDGIVVLGRFDDQVKIRGNRVEPGEVEAVLRKKAGIRDAVCLVDEDPSGTSLVCAYDGAEVPPAELAEFLSGLLPAYMIPARFVYVTPLPLTVAGKVDRAGLAAHLSLSPRGFVGPQA
jgi:amino acid adenylation domain-containing protein